MLKTNCRSRRFRSSAGEALRVVNESSTEFDLFRLVGGGGASFFRYSTPPPSKRQVQRRCSSSAVCPPDTIQDRGAALFLSRAKRPGTVPHPLTRTRGMGCTSAVHLWYLESERAANSTSQFPTPTRSPPQAAAHPHFRLPAPATPARHRARSLRVRPGTWVQPPSRFRGPGAAMKPARGAANRLRLGLSGGRPAGRNVPGAASPLSGPQPSSAALTPSWDPRQNDLRLGWS